MALRLCATCACLVHLIRYGHAVDAKVLHSGTKPSVAIGQHRHTNASPDKDTLLRDGRAEHAPVLASLKGSPPDSKDIEKEMLAAAQREAENSASAKVNAANMAKAASKKASELKSNAQVQVQKIASGAKATSDKSMSNAKASIKSAVDKETSALADTKASIMSAIKAVKIASTNEEFITANRGAHSACEAATASANKSMNQLQSMVIDAQNEAQSVRSATQKASDDIEQLSAKTKEDLDSLASQVAEVGSTASTKMEAKADGNAIATQTSQTADDIRIIARNFADETHETAVSTRSSGEVAANSILQMASDAKTRGDRTATLLGDRAKAAMLRFTNARDSWTRSSTSAMGTLTKALSPVDTVEVPEGSATTMPRSAPQDWAGSHTIGIIVFAIIVFGIVAAIVARETCFSKS